MKGGRPVRQFIAQPAYRCPTLARPATAPARSAERRLFFGGQFDQGWIFRRGFRARRPCTHSAIPPPASSGNSDSNVSGSSHGFSNDEFAIDICSKPAGETSYCDRHAARAVSKKLPTSSLRRLLSRESDCDDASTCDEAVPVSLAPRCTSVILEATCRVPSAAC
jgi:hypothetical protein